MSLVGHFRAMARNNAWSNHRLHAACARLSDEGYRARRTSFFPSLHLTLNHILQVDWYFLGGLEGGGRGLELSELGDEPCGTLAEVTAAQREADRRLIAYCDGIEGEGGLGATVVLLRPGGGRFEERAADVLAHLFVHQIHHRGQAHAMLSGTDVAPPQLDEFFLRQDAPLRADELQELRALGLS